jgi:hypothetical protein
MPFDAQIEAEAQTGTAQPGDLAQAQEGIPTEKEPAIEEGHLPQTLASRYRIFLLFIEITLAILTSGLGLAAIRLRRNRYRI